MICLSSVRFTHKFPSLFLIPLWLASCEQAPHEDDDSSGADGASGSSSSGSSASGGSLSGGGSSSGGRPQDGSGGSGDDTHLDPIQEFDGCEHPEVVKNCSNGWCTIPAGCFPMGSPPGLWGRGAALGETPVPVTLTRDFEIQDHEVTQAEWTALGFQNPSGKRPDGTGDCLEPDCPVGNVNWFEALAYTNALSARHDPPLEPCYVLEDCSGEVGTGMTCSTFGATASTVYECTGYRLPTEAEWEYAARAGTRTSFYSGEITRQPEMGTCYPDEALESIAWYCNNSEGSTHPVKQKLPNAWGLFDVIGNAREWTSDRGSVPRPEGAKQDPGGELETSERRQATGGGYFVWSPRCVVSVRVNGDASQRAPGRGFRLVRTLP